MYTVDTLKSINPNYDSEHRITQADVDIANSYVEAIRLGRTENHVQVGDIVELTTRYGDYYADAHIDGYEEKADTWSVCEHASPYIISNVKEKIRCLTSGGAWHSIPNNLTLIGKRQKFFNHFGLCGACPNGLIYFQAEVNVWEYKEPDPLHGEYSTKDWRKYYISYCADKSDGSGNKKGYFCWSAGFFCADKAEYEAWLKTFRGVEFKGCSPDQTAVFCYREKEQLVDKDYWDQLNLPMDTRFCNGINLCKVAYDDDAHIVTAYRFSNSGTLDPRRFKLYELARNRDWAFKLFS